MNRFRPHSVNVARLAATTNDHLPEAARPHTADHFASFLTEAWEPKSQRADYAVPERWQRAWAVISDPSPPPPPKGNGKKMRARKGQNDFSDSPSTSKVPDFVKESGSSGWIRTSNPPVNSSGSDDRPSATDSDDDQTIH